MKKLSEIGAIHSRHPVDGGLMPFDASLEQRYTVCILSADDRRELVAEAIKRWEAYKWHKLGGAKELEEFLEEQGL